MLIDGKRNRRENAEANQPLSQSFDPVKSFKISVASFTTAVISTTTAVTSARKANTGSSGIDNPFRVGAGLSANSLSIGLYLIKRTLSNSSLDAVNHTTMKGEAFG